MLVHLTKHRVRLRPFRSGDCFVSIALIHPRAYLSMNSMFTKSTLRCSQPSLSFEAAVPNQTGHRTCHATLRLYGLHVKTLRNA